MFNITWEVDGASYKAKYKAIEAARGNLNNISVLINGLESFKNYDWTIEPEQSLSSLITERCLQLRDKYDYLKLHFSGGSDSTTVLNYFLKNNIHVDEIIVSRYSMIDDFSCKSNFEINEYVIPYLKSIESQLKNTKIKIFDIGSGYYNTILNDSFFYKKNIFEPREFYVPKVKGNNFCHILCCFEPMLECRQGRWFDIKRDTDNLIEYKYNNIELFYFTPDLLNLHCKQSHIVKRAHKMYPNVHSKELSKKFIRDPAVAPTPDWLSKHPDNADTVVDWGWYPKSLILLKNATHEQRQKYMSILSTTINGLPIPRLSASSEIIQLDLGE